MGKHAAPRTSPLRGRTAQRAIAVSAGTFVLCLGAAAPALASTADPTPPPLPVPIPQPVSDAVQQVTDIAGVPNPLAGGTTAKPRHHRTGNKSHKAPARLKNPDRTVTPTATRHKAVTQTYAVPTITMGGLRSEPAMRTAAIDGRAPAMAHTPAVQRIVQTTSSRPLNALHAVPPTQDTARILMVAIAMTVVGGLASGHVKAAQHRATAW